MNPLDVYKYEELMKTCRQMLEVGAEPEDVIEYLTELGTMVYLTDDLAEDWAINFFITQFYKHPRKKNHESF